MTPEQQAAYVISQSACAIIEMEGMKTCNQERTQQGLSLAYLEQDFLDLPGRFGIHHNQVVMELQS